ncbi:AcrR family transcriptional regulator [Agromyces sp. 3263]|uniref:TetR/AcrR family transcriptional regulator n=1 Tax=Agromyces sp. 3263 TaxID=2817750 RepID=UPI002856AEBC|nr:helix-turn-helix domain-containing protein [Agromyces sp. 3263]MDR6907693.1 AcrR family transcriptional regulator [Agromyces sp. 3263]
MRSWVPVPGSTKALLVQEALTAFGARGYDAVGVTELAASAGVTIGSLYHHFGSKAGLYDVVRTDVERRVVDRMEGAAAVRGTAGPAGIATVLLVGYDYLVASGFARLLAEARPPEAGDSDPIADFFADTADLRPVPLGSLVLAAWRKALDEASARIAGGEDAAPVRAALIALLGGATPA